MISIVTAYYNRKYLFERTLKSLLVYYGKIEFEVIAVDDGSRKSERLEGLIKDFPFLRIIRIEMIDKWYNNSCIPFNLGFTAIKGDKVIIQNPECYHLGKILEFVDKNLTMNDYISFACFSLDNKNTFSDDLFFDKLNINYLINNNLISVKKDGDLGWYNHSKYRPVAFHFCSAIMKDDLYELGGFDIRFAFGIGYDDNEFVERIRMKGMNIKFVDDEIVLHQNHYNYMKNNKKSINNKAKLIQRNEQLFNELYRSDKNYKAGVILDNDYKNYLTRKREQISLRDVYNYIYKVIKK